MHLTKGGNVLEYWVKANALLKPRHSCPLSTLALERVEVLQHKKNKEKTPPLEIPICDVGLNKEFVVVHNRQHTKHVIQNIFKQLLKIT